MCGYVRMEQVRSEEEVSFSKVDFIVTFGETFSTKKMVSPANSNPLNVSLSAAWLQVALKEEYRKKIWKA